MRLTTVGTILSLLLLTAAGCAESAPINTIAPAQLTPQETEMLQHFTKQSFVADFEIGTEFEILFCEVWIERYERGEKTSQSGPMEYSLEYQGSKIKDRIIAAITHQTEETEVWKVITGAGGFEETLPRLPGTGTAWTVTPRREFEIGQPVIVGVMVAGEAGKPFGILETVFEGDQHAFNEVINNVAAYVIYMKVYEPKE